MVIGKQPPYCVPVGQLPLVQALLPAELGPLVYLQVAAETQSCYAVVMGFDRPTLAIPELVAMGSHHGPVLNPTHLTGGFPDCLQ